MSEPSPPRCGFVALLGAPNAGKSTLVNQMVGGKVAIVTHKAQTTRSLLRGIYVRGSSQVILVDTPGIFKPQRRLDRAMVDAAWSAAGDADAILLLHEARKPANDAETQALLARLKEMTKGQKSPLVYLAINKIDQVKKHQLLELAGLFNAAFPFKETFMIVALDGDGVADLSLRLAGVMPEGPHLYPDDVMSDIPARLAAAEVVREKLFLQLHDELPYSLTVETEQWEDREDGSIKIDQTIYVTNARHKAMCLGQGGARIKAVRVAAQKDLEAIFDCPVHLFLFVKEREKWQDDPQRYLEWGLNFDA